MGRARRVTGVGKESGVRGKGGYWSPFPLLIESNQHEWAENGLDDKEEVQ
jgi:hypothetical protein